MSYRTLDGVQIVDKLRQLEQRIRERFPESGLAKVCRELVSIGADTQHRAEAIAKPHTAVRIIVYVAIAAGVFGLVTWRWCSPNPSSSRWATRCSDCSRASRRR